MGPRSSGLSDDAERKRRAVWSHDIFALLVDEVFAEARDAERAAFDSLSKDRQNALMDYAEEQVRAILKGRYTRER